MPIEITLDRRFKFLDIVKMFIDVIVISYRFRVKQIMIINNRITIKKL
jgi:hypothetical protein